MPLEPPSGADDSAIALAGQKRPRATFGRHRGQPETEEGIRWNREFPAVFVLQPLFLMINPVMSVRGAPTGKHLLPLHLHCRLRRERS